jgi:hypothetical protein
LASDSTSGDAIAVESAAEVAGRRRIRNPPGSEGVEIALVVSQEFQMLQPRPARQKVVGDVQDVIRFVVRQVDLE